MVVLFYITLLIAVFSPPASAGIFKDEESLNASRKTAQPLNEHIFPGKIIVTDGLNEASWLDYASAFPIGKPGDTSTRTVVSAAHTYITSAMSYGNSQRHYCDYQGKRYDIEDTILLGGDKNLIQARESTRYAENDIVLYHLKEPIACNPLNDIPRNFEQYVSLTTLTYGWTIVAPENGGIAGNLDGSCSSSFDGEFEHSQNTYIYNSDADRLILLSDFYNESNFMADYLAVTLPQIYYHDSGAPWFTYNQNGGYSLTALTSRTTPVVRENPLPPIKDGVLSEKIFDWQDSRYKLSFFELKQLHPVQTTLTPLAPHRDWILKHCF